LRPCRNPATDRTRGAFIMDFRQVLRDACISLCLKSETKEEIVAEMVDLLVSAGQVKDRDAAFEAVMERERQMSTGMQHGVAIPHGKTDKLDNMAVALGLKPEGLDFEALDGEPSRIFIMTVSSKLRAGPHIQFLAAIGKVLNSASVRQRLLQAGSEEEIREILCEE